MGNVLIILGRDQEAETYYQLAIKCGMSEAMLLFSKTRAYYMKGDTQRMYFYLSELRKRKDVPPELEQIMNMLGVKNRERYTQLFHLCLVLTLIVATVRILRHRR